MSGVFLTLNAGSSSIKFAVFASDGPTTEALLQGNVAGIGSAPAFSAKASSGGAVQNTPFPPLSKDTNHEAVIEMLLPWLETHLDGQPVVAVGHRVVHGGQYFTAPTLVADDVMERLEELAPLAPLHQPHNIAAIRAVAKWHPDTPQIACFDTSFHRSQSRLNEIFALPRELSDQGVIRYGFHGLSYDFIASSLPKHLGDKADGKVIVAHLGNGSSMCAMTDRKSRASTMGFTALDGLMMGQRCGDLDPGVLLYLMQSQGMTPDEIETLLYKKSGLLGVSGVTNDMQILETSDDPNAQEAVDLFCYRAATNLAALIPSIGGLDALVFTAGIGENSALIRAKICAHLTWLGVSLDPAANHEHATVISAADSAIPTLVIPTNEEAIVARACRAHLTNS
ncbi:acetate/propionate family kinase [Sulfitobacter donghicola]|uniref:Acetate kinase n=1 Tax=Sulfitobacter donghicola DSW-25 = KCTC 12864 = JCM 14565 TaxID=1300350 RepID=A0A073IF00_9RHOB|nr:acetate/propionate family kinase [Sulfitobacter donghicola]KEJ88130.1 acetate kinase [Sulfitobacter donghicola DSW-25 = KCTC 12864 = JCM 14565]KIN70065.1 Acetate kinase [Sulfitobacter donghicola DSW-25 = KCTC 12864 = JCM 14565]